MHVPNVPTGKLLQVLCCHAMSCHVLLNYLNKTVFMVLQNVVNKKSLIRANLFIYCTMNLSVSINQATNKAKWIIHTIFRNYEIIKNVIFSPTHF